MTASAYTAVASGCMSAAVAAAYAFQFAANGWLSIAGIELWPSIELGASQRPCMQSTKRLHTLAVLKC